MIHSIPSAKTNCIVNLIETYELLSCQHATNIYQVEKHACQYSFDPTDTKKVCENYQDMSFQKIK